MGIVNVDLVPFSTKVDRVDLLRNVAQELSLVRQTFLTMNEAVSGFNPCVLVKVDTFLRSGANPRRHGITKKLTSVAPKRTFEGGSC